MYLKMIFNLNKMFKAMLVHFDQLLYDNGFILGQGNEGTIDFLVNVI